MSLNNLARVVVVNLGPLVVQRAVINERQRTDVLRILDSPDNDSVSPIFVDGKMIDEIRTYVDAPWGGMELASKGAIVASLTAAAGCRTTEIHLSDHCYEHILHTLPARHDRIAIEVTAGIRRGLVMYVPDGPIDNRIELVSDTGSWCDQAIVDLISVVDKVAEPGVNVVISGWVAMLSPGRLFRSLRTLTERSNARLLMDSRSLRVAHRCMPDVLKVTAAEASSIFGRKVANEAQVISLLSDYPLDLFIITCGAEGAYLRAGDCFAHLHRPASAVNPVGAGDSAMSVIAALYGTDMPVLEIARRAIYTASRNVEVRREGGVLLNDGNYDEVVVTPLRDRRSCQPA